jgi:hypothetical protein
VIFRYGCVVMKVWMCLGLSEYLCVCVVCLCMCAPVVNVMWCDEVRRGLVR